MRLPVPLIVVIGLFVVLCAAFNTATPYRKGGAYISGSTRNPDTGQVEPARIPDIGAPDERQHANYVRHLMDGKGFPVLVPGSPDLGETYQSHQPPLYYVIAAGWCKLLGADPAQESGGFRLRFLNTLIGALGLVGVYLGAVWGLQRPELGIAAAAVYGLLPMSLALHGAASNDPLLYCLCTWGLALALKGTQQGWTLKTAVWLGLVAGLALLTKTTGLVLVPVVLLSLAYQTFTKSGVRPSPVVVATALLVPALIALPWLLRNQSLYGDLFGITAFNAAFTGSPQAAMFIDNPAIGPQKYWLNMVVWWTLRSMVGMFGYMDIAVLEASGPDSDRFYIGVLTALMVLGLVATLRTQARIKAADEEGKPSPVPFLLLSATLGLATLVLFVRFNLQYFQAQARYLFPALSVLAYKVGMGLVDVAKSRPERAWLYAVALMVVLDLVSLATIRQGFAIRLQF